MRDFTYLSQHANERLNERTTMEREELMELLDRGAFINTGKAPGFNREHLLFWSVKDEQPFVAIRDKLSGKVVTVLPLDYHKNLAWDVNDERVQAAQEMAEIAEANPRPAPEKSMYGTEGHNRPPTRIRLLARFLTEDMNVKLKQIGTYPIEDYADPADLLRKLTDKQLDEACKRNGLSFANCCSFIAREGSRAEAWRDMW